MGWRDAPIVAGNTAANQTAKWATAPEYKSTDAIYAEEAKQQEEANREMPWYEQFGQGAKAQMARFALGATELAGNLTGHDFVDPEVLAYAQQGADAMDKGTGVAGFVGNVAGDPLTLLLGGYGGAAIQGAKTTGQAALAAGKAGAVTGAISGLTQGTGEADSTIIDNLNNAAIGGGLGAGMGATVPVATAGVKAVGKGLKGGAQRVFAGLGSETAADAVAYRNLAKVLNEQGFAPGEIKATVDAFKSQGIDGATLGQMLQSPDLLLREKNLLQSGGKAGRYMAEQYADQPKKVASAFVRKAKEIYQPERTTQLYKYADEFANTPTVKGGMIDGNVVGMGQSGTDQIPHTLNSIREELVEDADYIPSTTVKRIGKYIERAEKEGTFEAYDKLKQDLASEYTDKALNELSPDEKATNRIVDGYRKMLSASLDEVGGDPYQFAKSSARGDMAARDMIESFNTTNKQRIITALDKFFGSPEKEKELLDKLSDEATKKEFSELIENMYKVARRPGGSDTASNQATQAAMAGETGFGFTPDIVGTGNIFEQLANPISKNVRQSTAKAVFNPDTERLGNEILKQQFKGSAVNRAVPALGVQTGRASEAGDEGNNSPAPVRLQDVPKPQSWRDAPKTGIDEKMAMAESSGDPNAQNPNSTASGLYQFTDPTWNSLVNKHGRKYGITKADKNNPQAQNIMLQYLKEDNARQLKAKGLPVNEKTIYFTHFMGGPAGTKAMTMLGKRANAARSFPSAAKSNPTIFYQTDKRGKPIYSKPRTVDEVYQLVTSKVA